MARYIQPVSGFGISMLVEDWARSRYNCNHIKVGAIRERLALGWTLEESLMYPKYVHRRFPASRKVMFWLLKYPYATRQQIADMTGQSFEAVRKLVRSG